MLESRTASEMTDPRVLRLGRRVTPPGLARPNHRRSDDTLTLYCGIDWATAHHDVAVVDDNGSVVARGRVSNDAAGFARLLTVLAQAGDTWHIPFRNYRSSVPLRRGWTQDRGSRHTTALGAMSTRGPPM